MSQRYHQRKIWNKKCLSLVEVQVESKLKIQQQKSSKFSIWCWLYDIAYIALLVGLIGTGQLQAEL